MIAPPCIIGQIRLGNSPLCVIKLAVSSIALQCFANMDDGYIDIFIKRFQVEELERGRIPNRKELEMFADEKSIVFAHRKRRIGNVSWFYNTKKFWGELSYAKLNYITIVIINNMKI